MSLNGLNDSDSEISVVENCERHHLLGSAQGTTQPNVSQTSMVPEPYLDSVPYDEEPLNVSVSLQYDWQLSGHRFIGERVSRLYPNGQSAIGTVQKICLLMVMMKLYFIFFMMMGIKKILISMNVLLLWNSIVNIFHLLFKSCFCATF